LGQKYGGGKGWQLGLRFDESKPGEVMEFREQVGGVHSGLSCIMKDDRWRPVEIIRRSLGRNDGGLVDKRRSM
jgi:hypothetical protein